MNQPLELAARFNGPPRLVGNALVVLCGYRGGATRKGPWRLDVPRLGRVVDILTLFGLRQFVATYRDHYANPRSREYQLDMIQSLLGQAHFSTCDLLIDASLGGDVETVTPPGFGRVSVAKLAHRASIPADRYDTIILTYPDAIGLSWTAMEKQALTAALERVVVLNGRRRLFTLDNNARRKLRWRRFLANTRLVQFLAGIVAFPVGAVLATVDGMRGRT